MRLSTGIAHLLVDIQSRYISAFRVPQHPRFPDIRRTRRYGAFSRIEAATIETLEVLRNVAVYSLVMEGNQARCRGEGQAEFLQSRNEECSKRRRLDMPPRTMVRDECCVSIPMNDSDTLARSDRNHGLVALSMHRISDLMQENSIYHQVFIRPRKEAHDLRTRGRRKGLRFQWFARNAECRDGTYPPVLKERELA
ncbi:uncharacterized protein LACBIDRAFT_304050 [Laccaria bicolor S238N-H82]|uniref:Predicted protein n=1 Tax=Laccaria bicolor (strain S238N-H82 / ATCC MYA-4686) TaxID=486041 RepID=B0DKU7_LACBS|nr:uncharacterized protein LACBIDRAFT_304050 [Laccaria bicolor S238N-H82]EDR04802.1 predicted protein [Laccaria bicolor S238N-H82]|eukprot:XP_001884626.1 predicted protein [Laccaria bicolor S238N-H82]